MFLLIKLVLIEIPLYIFLITYNSLFFFFFEYWYSAHAMHRKCTSSIFVICRIKRLPSIQENSSVLKDTLILLKVSGNYMLLMCLLFNSAKLRARQKERLAKRNLIESPAPVQGPCSLVSIPQLPPSDVQEENQMAIPSLQSSVVDLENNNHSQTAGPNGTTDSTLKLGRMSKQKSTFHLDFPVISTGRHLPEVSRDNDQLQSSSSIDAVRNNLLPVIGLCAPNAPNRMELLQRKIPRPYQRQFKQGLGLDFPLPATCSASGLSNEITGKGNEAISAPYMLPDLLPGTSQMHCKSDVPNKYPPFTPVSNSLYVSHA